VADLFTIGSMMLYVSRIVSSGLF